MNTALGVLAAVVRDETHPAEVVVAAVARHVVAAAALLDVDAALRTLLCAEGLDLRERGCVFCFFDFAAVGFGVPGAFAGYAEAVAAVGAGDELLGGMLCLGLCLAFTLGRLVGGSGVVGAVGAVLDGEVFAAFGVEAGDEVGRSGEEVLRESGIVPGYV